MTRSRLLARRASALVLAWSGPVACSDGDGPAAPPAPVLTSISISMPGTSIERGQMVIAIAVGLDQNGAPLTIGPVEWASETPDVAAVNSTSGLIVGISEGATKITARFGGRTGERTVTVAKAAGIRVNEVLPKGDSRDGWIEFFNPTPAAVDMSGWSLIDNNFFGPTFPFPSGSIIQPGGYLVIEEAALPFGLESVDDAHLFSRYGVLVDVAFWASEPPTSYGHCPGGLAPFDVTKAATKGTANACS